ncbi:hypothetical protein HOE67_01600 [Candidatus Peregrinibacteria bacterium]|jgi:flagellar hook assembly protein FlgD|nr:hypothetical protein [Candidatus Peregrinibacteria bacterium]MBT4055782.1 hypothetical protein [Candidatus Peregrinibacteria bacterium]
MVKKLLSVLGIVSILSTMVVSTAFAADDDNLIKNLSSEYSSGVDATDFDASTGESVNFTFEIYEEIDVADAAAFSADVYATSGLLVRNLTTTVDCSAGAQIDYGVDGLWCPVTATWDGKDDEGAVMADGNYEFSVFASFDGNVDRDPSDAPLIVTIDTPEAIPVLEDPIVVLSETTWDPVTDGDLQVNYTLNKEATVTVTFDNAEGETVKTIHAGTNSSGVSQWDGTYSSDYVLPGDYDLTVKAADGTTTTTYENTITVVYEDSLVPELSNFESDPSDGAFDAEDEDVTVSFDLNHTSHVGINILDKNDEVVFIPENFDGEGDDSEYDSENLSFDWDGTDDVGCAVDTGTYTIEITATNDSGVAYDNSLSLVVNSDDSSTCAGGSSRIRNIDLDPSATSSSSSWDPSEEELEIMWDLTADFDGFTIEARKGGDVIEVYADDDLEEDDNYSVDFAGLDDDDDYLEPGQWSLVFLGEIDDVTYYVKKTFYVEYDKPTIDDTFITKSKIDPDLGEGVYFGFILENDALVDVEVLRDNKSKVDLLEDEAVDKELWYAVYWDGLDEDGDDFDYDDSYKIRLTAKSIGDDDTADTQTETVDLDEDDPSSARSNITVDYVLPPLVARGGEVVLSFNMEDDAELRVAIWDGTSTSGTADIELQDYKMSDSGDYEFEWDTKDDDGDYVKSGFYTYKLFSQKEGKSSTETETGKFLIDNDLGEVFGEPTEAAPSTPSTPSTPGSSIYACGFSDVSSFNPNCDAIAWARENGVSFGNPDGTYTPYDKINRAEVLSLVLRAFDLTLYADDGTNLGWTDVKVGSWYMSVLRTGKLFGLVSGDAGTTTVRPGADVSRAELLRFIYSAQKLAKGTDVPACFYSPYTDVLLGKWYTNYACQSEKDGLFDTLLTLFMPNEVATRGEVAEALYRLLK